MVQVNVSVEETTVTGVLPTQAEIAIIDKIISELEPDALDCNGQKTIPTAHKGELYAFVKEVVKAQFPEMTNRQIKTVMEAVFRGMLGFPMRGARLTIPHFLKIEVIRRGERNSSRFGERNVVPAKNYINVKAGKAALEAAAQAVNPLPHGNLLKEVKQKALANSGTVEL